MADPKRNTHRPTDTRMQRDAAQAERDAEQQRRADELSMVTAVEHADQRDGVWDGQSGELLESGMTEDRAAYLASQSQLGDTDDIVKAEDAQVKAPLGVVPASDMPPIGPNGVPITDERQRIADEEVIRPPYTPTAADLPEEQSPQPHPAEDPEVAKALALLRERGLLDEAPRQPAAPSAPPARRVQRMEPVKEKMVVWRSAATVEPTIGQGPNSRWSFKKGRRYETPLYVAEHMDEKGLVASWG